MADYYGQKKPQAPSGAIDQGERWLAEPTAVFRCLVSNYSQLLVVEK